MFSCNAMQWLGSTHYHKWKYIYIYIYIYIHRVYGAYLVQFTAGMAYPLARACSNRLYKSSPVTTPAGTISLKDAMILSCLYDDNNIEVQIGLELFIQHDERNLFSKEERRKKHCSVVALKKILTSGYIVESAALHDDVSATELALVPFRQMATRTRMTSTRSRATDWSTDRLINDQRSMIMKSCESRSMNDEWWMMNDEWWMMNDLLIKWHEYTDHFIRTFSTRTVVLR